MKQISDLTSDKLNNQILEFCRHVAGSARITAIAYVDNYSNKTFSEKTIIDVMLVIKNFQPRIIRYLKTFNEQTIFVLAVDQWIFERDIEIGLLGEAIAGKLIFPHFPLYGKDYLQNKEVALKKRLILELLQNLASSFPELTERMQIKPQYFMYEVLLNRIRVFPLLAYDAANLVNGLTLNQAENFGSYNKALRQLEVEGKISFLNDYVKMSKRFLVESQDPRIKLVNLAKNAPRTIFTSIFGTFPQLINIISQNNEAFMKSQKINWRQVPDTSYLFINPQKYVFFQTSEGLVSLSDKIDIKDYVQKMLLKDQDEDVEVEPAGGMLNDVYVISVCRKGRERKVIAKRFKDWSGFKWFPLTIWSLGTRPFAITAQARLAKECAISELLYSEGFNVPKILHVSNAERLIFMEYIEGESLSQDIKRIATGTEHQTFEKELANICKTGEIFAKIHSYSIVLGDTKPENMIVKPNGTIYMIDFEQAAQDAKGDKAWDVAVFLYYSGHYLQPRYGNSKAESIAKAFINGYLNAGGDVEVIKKAGTPKYTRIFSIFTMWNIITTISNVCKKTEALK
ncbi:MAG TPA: RIO1 family regulatory kinase/ATPase [Verrucomicrobiae bacterium]|nr:RIO1 family regulatory kinase/ATPase [Verrucomicrobiae bacterium]